MAFDTAEALRLEGTESDKLLLPALFLMTGPSARPKDEKSLGDKLQKARGKFYKQMLLHQPFTKAAGGILFEFNQKIKSTLKIMPQQLLAIFIPLTATINLKSDQARLRFTNRTISIEPLYRDK
ncbi:hypothetical protein TWF281_005841 [Arthrobotrys megalospora]